MNYQHRESSQFKKDYKNSIQRKLPIELLDDIIRQLVRGETLDSSHRDHALKGIYTGCRECHVQPDWLLVYRKQGNVIIFVRTGTHSDLF